MKAYSSFNLGFRLEHGLSPKATKIQALQRLLDVQHCVGVKNKHISNFPNFKRTLFGNWQKTTRELFWSQLPVRVEPMHAARLIGKLLELPLQKVLICLIWSPYETTTFISNSGLLAVRIAILALDGSTSSLASLVLPIVINALHCSSNACVINKPNHT